MSRSWRQQHNSCGPEIFFRNGDGWSSEVNKVQRGLKFSVVFLVKHNFLWLIPEAAPNILQRQPCLRENSYLCLSPLFSIPWGWVQGCCPKWDPRSRWRAIGGREQLTTPLPFPPAKPACVSSPHHFFQPLCGSRGESPPSPPCLAGEVGGAPLSQAVGGAGEWAGFQAVLLGECLHRSCWFIINCWRTGEYAQRG